MPSLDRHAPGSFCWFELATIDQSGAKQFYQALFGWDPSDTPIGPSEMYTSFKRQGRDVAAAYTMRPEQRAQGVPPNWMIYVRVVDVDDTAARVEFAGGIVVAPPFDVMDLGRMAVIQDPTGGMFSIWQARRNEGTGLVQEHGTAVWADLVTPDQQTAGAFYSSLLGWKMVSGKSMVAAKPGEYFHIVNGTAFIGGIPPPHAPGIPAHWLIYFAVPDCAATIAKATSLGGRVIFGPMTIENNRTFASLADPQGAIFAIVNTTS